MHGLLLNNANASLQSKKVIIIPPNQIYLSGCESLIKLCNTCKNKNLDNRNDQDQCNKVCKKARIYRDYAKLKQNVLCSDLGKSIYQNMIEGITIFNKRCVETNKKFKYRLNTNDKIPIANHQSNTNINSFYSKVKSNTSKLSTLLRKKDSDAFVWIEHNPGFKTAVSNCIASTSCENQNLKATVVLFDGQDKHTKEIFLKFKKGYMAFSIKSMIELKFAVAELLFDNRFPQPVKTEDSSNKTDRSAGKN